MFKFVLHSIYAQYTVRDKLKFVFASFASAFSIIPHNKRSLTFFQDLELVLRHCVMIVFGKFVIQGVFFKSFSVITKFYSFLSEISVKVTDLVFLCLLVATLRTHSHHKRKVARAWAVRRAHIKQKALLSVVLKNAQDYVRISDLVPSAINLIKQSNV